MNRVYRVKSAFEVWDYFNLIDDLANRGGYLDHESPALVVSVRHGGIPVDLVLDPSATDSLMREFDARLEWIGERPKVIQLFLERRKKGVPDE